MICDALQVDEIFEAYVLYASLHGLNTEPAIVQQRIDDYLNNQPDSVIDEAILSFAEDRIVAPPDVVLPCWGKSRVYDLREGTNGQWRHQVCEAWFESGCQFPANPSTIPLAHFWTAFAIETTSVPNLPRGTRLQLLLQTAEVRVAHRTLGELGQLPVPLTGEIMARRPDQIRYLALVDTVDFELEQICCKLLIVTSIPELPLNEIVNYASRAFQAPRTKC